MINTHPERPAALPENLHHVFKSFTVLIKFDKNDYATVAN